MKTQSSIEKSELENTIGSLIAVVREILENLHQEQQGILNNQSDYLEKVFASRLKLFDELVDCREKVLVLLPQRFPDMPVEVPLIEQLGLVDREEIDILLMRDRLQALCEAIDRQSGSNCRLLAAHPAFQKYALDPQLSVPKKLALALMTSDFTEMV